MTVLDRTIQFMAMHIQLPQTMLCKDFMLKVIVFTHIISTSVCTEELVPVQVSRRYSNDIYYGDFELRSHNSCNEGDNVTFVVSERRCVSNEELHNGKHMKDTFNHNTIMIMNTQVVSFQLLPVIQNCKSLAPLWLILGILT